MADRNLIESIRHYLGELQHEYSSGRAREHAYRPPLERLLEAIDEGLNAVNEPQRSEAGAPDFVVLRASGNVPVGYVECKDIGTNLNTAEQSEQIKRYHTLGNLILTNYLEFRWYVNGERRMTARAGDLSGSVLRISRKGVEELAELLTGFAMQEPAAVGTPVELAQAMARAARAVERLILSTYNGEGEEGPLHSQHDDFQKMLIPDLTPQQFADMYAQTITYGLFAAAARWDSEGRRGEFNRYTAEQWMPPTNPFMRDVFHAVIGAELPEQVGWLVDEGLVRLLARADLGEIMRGFGRATRQDDPVVHFYEDFLAAYDPALRERRGVYYTPEPVVSYIVRSVDCLLRERFDMPDGLADSRAVILDPAVGTGTFLYFVIRHIHEFMMSQGQGGMWQEYVRDRLLPRLFGFELLMAPYTVAHMKLGIQLQETGYRFEGDRRLGIFLTNALEPVPPGERLPGLGYSIAREGRHAERVRQSEPVMVVMGNPPYSGHSANKGEWIRGLVQDYYSVDGRPLGERNPKWLQDDYVKFLRFGQWRIAQTGGGILAFITNNGYLDNPTFRGMRQQLMQAFSEIYILNLHGSSKKKERAPDGGPDENVFDIQQGVAIGIFVRQRGAEGPARVFHADLWGERGAKYAALEQADIRTTEWRELAPDSPFYMFVPQATELRDEYLSGWGITSVLPINTVGVVTGQDSRTIAFMKEEANSLAELHGLESQDVSSILYRPFDMRYIVYNDKVVTRPRMEVMRYMLAGENVGLISARGIEVGRIWDQVVCGATLIQHHTLSLKEVNYLFPLYLYPNEAELLDASPWPLSERRRRPNLDPAFVQEVSRRLGMAFITDGRGDLRETFGPEDVFHYIYAVFHSPTYRTRYAEFLRIDFPRVPLTSDVDLFRQLCALGADLVALHLMRSTALNKLRTAFPVSGSNRVENGYPRYTEPSGQTRGRVYINKSQYFEGIEPKVWEFHIGGYQVLDKWLKDRRGRTLTYDDVVHYQRIVVALSETMRLMGEIDAAIGRWPIR